MKAELGLISLASTQGLRKCCDGRSISAPSDVGGTTCREISRARGLFGSEKEKKKKKYPYRGLLATHTPSPIADKHEPMIG